MISKEGQVRARQTGVVNNSQEEVYKSALKQDGSGNIGKVVYNRRIVYAEKSARGYLAHFSPRFLFLEGDGNLRHGVSGVGIFYLWGIFFIIPGFLVLTKIEKKKMIAIIAWILLAPIPAAVSVPAPHALRSLNMIPIPQLLIALGMVWFLFFVGRRYRQTASAVLIGVILYFMVSFFALYFGEYANKSSSGWADGYKQLAEYVFENENKYEKILISGHYWQPYSYFLFYKKYDPDFFQKSGSKSGFDKYVFGGTGWDGGKELGDQDLVKLAGGKNFLIALSPIEYELQKDNLSEIGEIRNHNNELVFVIAVPK